MRLIICAVGSITLGEQASRHNFGVKNIIKNKGSEYIFKDLKDIPKNKDIFFQDLKAQISSYTDKQGFERKYYKFSLQNVIKIWGEYKL